MPGRLTTHVLDTAGGRPAEGMRIDLYRLDGEAREHVAEAVTNADGRTNAPMLEGAAFAHGAYELVFRAGDWLDAGQGSGRRRFLGDVPIRFGIDEDAHYHVPLLLSPFGYATYRGS